MLVWEKTSIHFTIKFSLREILCCVQAGTRVRADDVNIVHSTDAQCNTEQSP